MVVSLSNLDHANNGGACQELPQNIIVGYVLLTHQGWEFALAYPQGEDRSRWLIQPGAESDSLNF
jgi:hypothetical protein